MNRQLWLLTLAQGLFFTNNVTFIAINGLVGLSLAPVGWMATLPVMGYVVGSALSAALVSRTQAQWGRKKSFQTGLVVAFFSCALALWALMHQWFWLLVAATFIAGYYSANAQLYRFAAAELAPVQGREKAVSWVMAGGLMGAIIGPNLANQTKDVLGVPFAGAYLSLMGVAVLAWLVISSIDFGPTPAAPHAGQAQRSWGSLLRQPVFFVAALSAALGYGVMNLLMAATPLAMQTCGIGFSDTALVLEWHVIGMFAPGFFTGHLIAALILVDKGTITPKSVGAKHGEVGHTQFLPGNVLAYGVDGNGDGKVDLNNLTDAMASTANFLAQKGWQPGRGYQEGEPNFAVIKQWNAATVYQQAIAVMGAQIDG